MKAKFRLLTVIDPSSNLITISVGEWLPREVVSITLLASEMKNITTLILASVCLLGCSSSPELKAQADSGNRTNALHATISVKQTEFDLASGDEVDITFKVINQSSNSVPSGPVRDTTRLKINGTILVESEWLFSNGLHSGRDTLRPAETEEFLYRLTRYFSRKGVYVVSWHGDYFDTAPIVFRVIKAK